MRKQGICYVSILCYCLFFILLFVISTEVSGQEKAGIKDAKTIALDQKLPVDPKITTGIFSNGLKYYIKENKKPERRAELRLVIDTGSIEEDDGQQGLAHFVEHMAFNGTRHFKKQELINYLESIGMRFGPELNAYTSFDETTYMLTVPTDKPELMEKAFLILEDWAYNMSLDNDEIDNERGVIIEEWRLGRGAQQRMNDIQFPILLKDSRYADRLPIGKKEIIESFEHETLKRFYREWYRPGLMAVIAVGDFDKSVVKNLIKKHFEHHKPVSDPRPRRTYEVPEHKETLFAIASDKEATNVMITVYYKQSVRKEGKVGLYRQNIVERIYNSMLNQRFTELTQKSDPPFVFGYSNQSLFVRSKEAYMLGAMVKENGIETGLEALLTEAERIDRFGFTGSELERQKKEVLRSIEQSYKERGKSNSSGYAAEYIRAFIQNEPIPGIEYEFELYKRFVPEITLEEVNKLASEWITDKNRVILVNAPEKEGLNIPSEEDLLKVFEAVKNKTIEAYEDKVSAEELVTEELQPVKIVEEKFIKDVNITEWVLANGVKVVIKPTDFKEDQILLRAFSPGGTSLAEDEDFYAVHMASVIMSQSGVGNFSAIELQKKLAGKVVNVLPLIGELEEGLTGSASPKDIEELFQLIYLNFTNPRQDEEVFKSLKARFMAFLKNRSANPLAAFQDTMQVTLSNYHNRTQPVSAVMLDRIDLDKSIAFYKERFADAGDFTFVFAGNINPETFKPFVERYLANLPSTGRKESWRDIGKDFPMGVILKEVRKGIDQKSQTGIIFTGPFADSRKNRHVLHSLKALLQIKLREKIREKLGGTYSVNVNSTSTWRPDEEYIISISFGSDPDRVDELTLAVFQEIDSLKISPASEEYISKVKEIQHRTFETDMKKNNYWLNQIVFRYQDGSDPAGIITYDKIIDGLEAAAVQEAAKLYFNMNNYVKISLFPEEKKGNKSDK